MTGLGCKLVGPVGATIFTDVTLLMWSGCAEAKTGMRGPCEMWRQKSSLPWVNSIAGRTSDVRLQQARQAGSISSQRCQGRSCRFTQVRVVTVARQH